MLSQHYDVQLLAERLAVSQDTIRKLVKTGKLQGVKISGAVRVSEDSLNDYLDRQTLRKAPAKKPEASKRPSKIKASKDWFAG